ncbi:MAG: ATP-binding protein [Gammaproteobacteria bacterium]|nr:ATP-binding protein [Gammaproteobacteria bacterium]
MATFKTRARTLDMLGRQQIAGIPTAISELFKNAHDAYASRVEIDYYRSGGLFVLRDDGMGMTRDDFVSRWLTIGTESKLDGLRLPPRRPGMDVRPMLGEKGIGRLAIATIGAQVLVLTRARTPDGLSDLTVAFLNWGVFEWPGVDLDEIEVPMRTYSGDTLPSASDVDGMIEQFGGMCAALTTPGKQGLDGRLADELAGFVVDPVDVDGYEPSLSLRDGSGTHFIIQPSSDLLPDDIDGDPHTDKARR